MPASSSESWWTMRSRIGQCYCPSVEETRREEQLNAEGAKITQRTRKNSEKEFNKFLSSFCVLCVTFASSAFGCWDPLAPNCPKKAGTKPAFRERREASTPMP